MTTVEGIDLQNKEKGVVAASELPSKPKILPPPFIIYSETNEDFGITDEIYNVESEMVAAAKKNKRRHRRNRNRSKRGLEDLDSLVLPEGIVLVDDGISIGFHCTFCKCIMSSMKTVEEHAGGNPHKAKLRSKAIKGEDTTANADSQALALPKEVPLSNAPSSTPTLVPKMDVPLLPSKSHLSKFILKTKEPIVGLDHVIEVQLPNMPPTYRCNICILDCDSDSIKDHIIGTRHRLSYLRIIDTQKIAEMLALNLKKPERVKRTTNHCIELQTKYGTGTLQVTNVPLPPITVAIQTETKASAQPQAAIKEPRNNPPIIIWTDPPMQKPENVAVNPVRNTTEWKQNENAAAKTTISQKEWKHRENVAAKTTISQEEWKQKENVAAKTTISQEEWKQRGNVAITTTIPQEEFLIKNQDNQNSTQKANLKRPNEEELHSSKRQSTSRNFQGNQRYNSRRGQGSTFFDRRPPPVYQERESNYPDQQFKGRHENKEQFENKLFERRKQHTGRGAYTERSESWRSYSEDNVDSSTPSRPQMDQQMTLPSKQIMDDSSSRKEDFAQHINANNQPRYESANVQNTPGSQSMNMKYTNPTYEENHYKRGGGGNRSRRGRGASDHFNSRNPYSRNQDLSRYSAPMSNFRGFSNFGRSSLFSNLMSDPLSIERDNLKMKYPGLRLGK